MSEFDIRSPYTSIAGAIVNRAVDAHGRHGDFPTIDFAVTKVSEEYLELMAEMTFDSIVCGKETSAPNLEADTDWQRVYEESIDLGVVSVRNAALAKAMIERQRTIPASAGTTGQNTAISQSDTKLSLSDVILGGKS